MPGESTGTGPDTGDGATSAVELDGHGEPGDGSVAQGGGTADGAEETKATPGAGA